MRDRFLRILAAVAANPECPLEVSGCVSSPFDRECYTVLRYSSQFGLRNPQHNLFRFWHQLRVLRPPAQVRRW